VEHALSAVRVMVNPADFAALESSWEQVHSEARLVADPGEGDTSEAHRIVRLEK